MIINNYNDKELLNVVDRMFGLSEEEKKTIIQTLPSAWERCMYCFSKINNPRFSSNGIQVYHTVQYCMFLYFLQNEIFRLYLKDGKKNEVAQNVCDKLFWANTSFFGVDIFYEQELPDIFLPADTNGIVFTPHASVGNYFMFMQGCNLGIRNGIAPKLGEGVVMFGNSKIIGNCNVGDYVMFGANAYVIDMDIPSNSIVFGQYPNVIIKENRKDAVMKVLKERFIM